MTSLQQKRNTFAQQIRRQQKRQIFREIRKQILESGSSLISSQSGKASSTNPKIEFQIAIKNVLSNKDQQYSLWSIARHLQSERYKYLTYQLFQRGIQYQLIRNLHNQNCLKQTLEIFSIILSKDDLHYAEGLVNKGLLQMLIVIINDNNMNTNYRKVCINIMGNVCVEEDSFCQILIENMQHRSFIEIFKQEYRNFVNSVSKEDPESLLKVIVWMLTVLVATKGQSNIDYSQQHEEILNFMCELLQNKILVKQVLYPIYELSDKIPKKVYQRAMNSINQLLKEQTGESKYIQELLILIKKLTPGPFNYKLLLKFAMVSSQKVFSLTIDILDRLTFQTIPQFQPIQMNQFWWEKTLIKAQNQNQTSRKLLKIIRRLEVLNPSVWSFIHECLCQTYSEELMEQSLLFLNLVISKNRNNLFSLIEDMEKHKIVKRLQMLMEAEKHKWCDKCEDLLQSIHDGRAQFKARFDTRDIEQI